MNGYVNLDEVKTFGIEPRWFESGVKEAYAQQRRRPVQTSVIRSSVPKVTTLDTLTLVGERKMDRLKILKHGYFSCLLTSKI